MFRGFLDGREGGQIVRGPILEIEAQVTAPSVPVSMLNFRRENISSKQVSNLLRCAKCVELKGGLFAG